VYCPEGSAVAVLAAPGEYTIGPTPATRTGVLPCPSGSYCVGGVRSPCEAGTFGCADRLSAPICNGPCAAGFFCPAGSVSSQEASCGGNASSPNAASYFCPQGAAVSLRVGAGNFSTGSAEDAPHRRTGQAVCSPGRYCAGGVSVRVPVFSVSAFHWHMHAAGRGELACILTASYCLPCTCAWVVLPSAAVPARPVRCRVRRSFPCLQRTVRTRVRVPGGVHLRHKQRVPRGVLLQRWRTTAVPRGPLLRGAGQQLRGRVCILPRGDIQ
jgi:hypothetical protein